MANLPMPPTNFPGSATKPDGVMIENTNINQPVHLTTSGIPMPPEDAQLQEAAVGYPS